jgi:hypothetical protein
MKCPFCRKDIEETRIVSAAGSILAKRRAKLTPEKARAMQKASAEARARKYMPKPE